MVRGPVGGARRAQHSTNTIHTLWRTIVSDGFFLHGLFCTCGCGGKPRRMGDEWRSPNRFLAVADSVSCHEILGGDWAFAAQLTGDELFCEEPPGEVHLESATRPPARDACLACTRNAPGVGMTPPACRRRCALPSSLPVTMVPDGCVWMGGGRPSE